MLNYKVLFLTNYPSPYRVDFFNLLGQSADLTVLFTAGVNEQKHRENAWFNENYTGFHAVFLKNSLSFHGKRICYGVIDYLKQNWDVIISGGYSSLTQMLAFEWLKAHHKTFYMEMDGGLIKDDNAIKSTIKRRYISMPNGYFSSGKMTDDYLIHYGAKNKPIWRYPFTSYWQADLDCAKTTAKNSDKAVIREALGMQEKQIVIAVGQFIYGKGFDVLIKSAAMLPRSVGVYIIGGNPTDEYLSLCKQVGANNVHFVGFKPKEDLKKYYWAADVFAMPTRSDVWGLVVNEALSFGIPVISSDQCGAALELIKEGKNGSIVPVNDPEAMTTAILKVLSGDTHLLSMNSIASIEGYSIENMVGRHIEIFDELSSSLVK